MSFAAPSTVLENTRLSAEVVQLQEQLRVERKTIREHKALIADQRVQILQLAVDLKELRVDKATTRL